MYGVREQRQMIRKVVMILILICLVATLVGCNTIEGMGRDISEAGEAISDAARNGT